MSNQLYYYSMEKINFKNPEIIYAKRIFDFFKITTDCLDAQGNLVICPRYVVALGDDPITAFYAASVMKKTITQFGLYPELLCCGGHTLFSKCLHQATKDVVPQGIKLAHIARQLNDAFPVKSLPAGNNPKDILKEVIAHLHGDPSAVIFCPTQRMSKIWERWVDCLPNLFPKAKSLNAYWYVPDENFEDIFALYNGGALAEGISLLSEAAAIYDALNIAGNNRHLIHYDGLVPKYVIEAGIFLRDHYPLFITQSIWSAPRQYFKLYCAFRSNFDNIQTELQEKINVWKSSI